MDAEINVPCSLLRCHTAIKQSQGPLFSGQTLYLRTRRVIPTRETPSSLAFLRCCSHSGICSSSQRKTSVSSVPDALPQIGLLFHE
jgi:hypothetical protein